MTPRQARDAAPASKLPRLVVLAAVAAGFDLADLFCYEISPGHVVLTSSSTGETIRVDRAQLETSRKFGPPPEDTRAQVAPGRAEARPCDDLE